MLINSFARKSIICVYDVCIYFEKKKKKIACACESLLWTETKVKGTSLVFPLVFLREEGFSRPRRELFAEDGGHTADPHRRPP